MVPAPLSPNFVKLGPVVPEIWPSNYVARGAILLCNVSQVSLCTVIPKFFCHFPLEFACPFLRFFPITLIACVGFNADSCLTFLDSSSVKDTHTTYYFLEDQ